MADKYRRLFGLCDLNPDIISHVTGHLELTDHFSLCISLCSGVLIHLLDAARFHFRARVHRLSMVWRLIYIEWVTMMPDNAKRSYIPLNITHPVARRTVENLLGGFRTAFSPNVLREFLDTYLTREYMRSDLMGFPPPPTVLAANLESLSVGFLNYAIVEKIADELPHIDWLCITQGVQHNKFDKMNLVPENMARFGSVTTLVLRISGLSMISEGILSMSNLKALHISDAKMYALPDDIGTRLPRLTKIQITRCPICTLPVSLLRRIEDYLLSSQFCIEPWCISEAPIVLVSTRLSRQYLDSVLKAGEFDLLRAACQSMRYI